MCRAPCLEPCDALLMDGSSRWSKMREDELWIGTCDTPCSLWNVATNQRAFVCRLRKHPCNWRRGRDERSRLQRALLWKCKRGLRRRQPVITLSLLPGCGSYAEPGCQRLLVHRMLLVSLFFSFCWLGETVLASSREAPQARDGLARAYCLGPCSRCNSTAKLCPARQSMSG